MNTNSYPTNSANRRNSLRWYPPYDFMISRVDEPSKYTSGATVLNVSEHGAELLTYRDLNVGDEIYINVGGRAITTGKVLRREPEWDYWDIGGLYRMAVKITDPFFNWPD